MLLIGMPIVSKATPPSNTAPAYVISSPQTIAVCQNSTGVDISSYLTINDPDLGQTETWTVLGSGPLNGTVAPTTYAASSTGGVVTLPANSFTYTPNFGFAGPLPDTFTIEVNDGAGGVADLFFNMAVVPPPSLTVGYIDSICMGVGSVALPFSGLTNVGPTTSTYNLSNGATAFTVPAGVTSINFDITGGAGGSDSHSGAANPGKGGRVQGTLAVTPGEVLYLYVGGQGFNGALSPIPGVALGGFNGGGNAYFYSPFAGSGGGGGGASDIRIGGNALSNRVIVAGGGGGNGWDTPGPLFGGCGGNNAFGFGGNSADNNGHTHSGGGSQAGGGLPATYAGWSPGTAGTLGAGGNGSVQGISGAGGGGYYGGGGGVWTGGGGGSSYTRPANVSAVTHTQCYNSGDGQIVLNYVLPGTYTVQWSTEAQTAGGFPPAQTGVLPSSPITLTIPGSAPALSYSGTFFINNTLCQSQEYPITVTVNPIPDVASVTTTPFCNGDAGASITFTNVVAGMYSGTEFDWSNSNTAIGVGPSGIDSIAAFTATNNTVNPITGSIMVTPKQFGCVGTPISFDIVVNPTPMLSDRPTDSVICNYGPFTFTPTSGTLGTSFLWSVAAPPGVIAAAPTGSDNPDDSITNTTNLPVAVPFVYTLAANSCINTQTINVTVNPTPVLTLPTTATVCSGHPVSYIASSTTPGATLAWSRLAAGGITPATNFGTGNINETLTNATSDPVPVTYVYTNSITTTGVTCSNTQNVTVTVNPMPVLNGSPLPTTPICNDVSDSLSFYPTSATLGTTFSWTRASTTGISNGPNFGSNAPSDVLHNNTPFPVNATYVYTLAANGCSNTQDVTITVNPSPKLNSGYTMTICDNTVVNYPPSSLTPSTTFEFQRNPVLGISNGIYSNFGNPALSDSALNNITALPVVDTYFYTLTAYGCSDVEKVAVTVDPKPTLSTSLTAPTICDSNVFNYPVTSNTPGVSFEWYRAYIPGIYAAAESGSGNPNQQLINSTYVVVPVVYTYTLTFGACTNIQNVTVLVNPTPRLTSSLTGAVCSGSPFNYMPTSFTPGTLYNWNRPAVGGISPNTNFGVGNISETVTNSGLSPITVDYLYRLTIGDCPNLYYQTLKVAVNPTPPAPGITTTTPASVCANTLYQNFMGSSPGANIDYTWSVSNGTIFATGANHQNALVNFFTAGNAVVTLTANVNGFSCTSRNSIDVNVTNNQADVVPVVIYNNGQFICLQNNNDSYQWGYDDLTTLLSTVLNGEINQNYDNSNPDLYHKHYWVITNTGGCMQKAYYDDPPTGLTNLNAGETDVRIYPNPATDNISIEVNTTATGKMQVEVLNMLGQRLAAQPLVNNKASINVESFPAGNYIVGCYLNGVKVANAKFTKN